MGTDRKYVYLDSQKSTSYLAHWKDVGVGEYVEGIYLVLGASTTAWQSVPSSLLCSLQLDDPVGAVIGQRFVLLTAQGLLGGSGTTEVFNGFLPIDVLVSSPGQYTLLYNGGPPTGFQKSAILTDPVLGILQGTAMRVRL